MAERIVVSLHLRAAGSPEPGYLRRALAAKKRAEILGAALCAWGPDSFAFDFAADEVEEAVDLALATFDDPTSPGPKFGAGMAVGAITPLEPGGPTMLAWGEPVAVAWRLARLAEPGEVLIDARCRAHLAATVRIHGERRVELEAFTALVLDTRHPFQRDTMIDSLDPSETRVRVTVPPLPSILGLSRDLLDRASAPVSAPAVTRDEAPPTIRTAPLSSTEPARSTATPVQPVVVAVVPPPPPPLAERATEPGAERRTEPGAERPTETGAERPTETGPEPSPEPPEVEISEVASSDVVLSEPALSEEAMSEEAMSEHRVAFVPPAPVAVVPPPRIPVPQSAPTVPPPGAPARQVPASAPPLAAGRISWPGASDEYAELTAAARQALLKGNVSELERLSDELKTRGEADLADRMAGFVAWNRGAKAEGLRKLRVAADTETRPAHRVRALLAYGVALAASGRTDAALLAALGALARAREVEDRQGEHVCARFLARLSAAAGYDRAAETWAAVADEVDASRSA